MARENGSSRPTFTTETTAGRPLSSQPTSGRSRLHIDQGWCPRPLPSSARYTSGPSLTPPRFIVNLSDPPEERYIHIAPAFRDKFNTLPGLYQEVLESVLPLSLTDLARRLSRRLLRRVYDREETLELRGISKATGIQMELLVAFNVLLDLFMGCTSGGVQVRDHTSKNGLKMLHFRALDWGMDVLRKIVMEVEYVRKADGPVVARSVTYFGYVGVLTGVRDGLSMSLNFRPHHDGSNMGKHVRYGFHLLMVLFGYRRSISSVLRGYLLPQPRKVLDLVGIIEDIQHQKSTAAYLIFCDQNRVVNVEKDNGSATIEESTEYLVTLNHDIADEAKPAQLQQAAEADPTAMAATGMLDLVAGSIDRKECAMRLYEDARRYRRKYQLPELPLEEQEVVSWMEGNQVVNDETHYAVIMDASAGEFVWLQRFEEPEEQEQWPERRAAAAKLRAQAHRELRRRAKS